MSEAKKPNIENNLNKSHKLLCEAAYLVIFMIFKRRLSKYYLSSVKDKLREVTTLLGEIENGTKH